MNRYLPILGIVFFIISCKSTKLISDVETTSEPQTQILKDRYTFLVSEVSDNKTYGLSPKNPIEVGGVKDKEGPLNERRYLNALAGPNGEEVFYYRAGSCCPVKSDNDPFGLGRVMLDNYRVTWEGAKDTVSIYINMYDYSTLKAPVGFTIKK